jgi:drug/metabolite transporter (DMT)-like permease
MAAPPSDRDRNKTAVAALLFGVTVWGSIWFPYRLLYQAGLSPVGAALLTDIVALAVGCVLWRRVLSLHLPSALLLLIAVTSGGANVGYILGTVYGQVMRVMLLFYLAPLWTVVWARLLLGERAGWVGLPVFTVSLGGAAIMLWRPEQGLPWPSSAADWIGLASGVLFALSNVLVRKAGEIDNRKKSLAAFLGVILVGTALLPFDPTPVRALANIGWPSLVITLATGLALVVATRVVYYGVSHLPANRAIVIMLFELVVAALAAWLLAGEAMTARDWLGGGLIVAASLFSGRIGKT